MDQFIGVAGFILIFTLAIWRKLHMGAVALGIAYVVGTLHFDLGAEDISNGFPGQLVITLIGVTYFFGLGRINGTVDQIVESLVAAVRGRVVLLPWVFFALAAAISASGALTVAVLSILMPIGMAFARTHRINPLLMGLSIINGTNAGGFSPVAIYYIIISSLFEEHGITIEPIPMFFWTFTGSLLINIAVFLLFQGRQLIGVTVPPIDRASALPDDPVSEDTVNWTGTQRLTVVIMIGIIIGALVFQLDVGYMTIIGALILASLQPHHAQAGLQQIGWGVVLLIGGMVTYVNMLNATGVIESLAHQVASIGTPLIAALLLLWVSGFITSFASSNAMFVILTPLSAPLLAQGDLPALGFAIALALAVVPSDCSPFSTAGALVVANTEEHRRDRVHQRLMIWAFSLVAITPFLAWFLFVVIPS
jgi:Na+/H+ antiporter NhaD/arsenite permease-like protein